jgi:hypothetical protein
MTKNSIRISAVKVENPTTTPTITITVEVTTGSLYERDNT